MATTSTGLIGSALAQPTDPNQLSVDPNAATNSAPNTIGTAGAIGQQTTAPTTSTDTLAAGTSGDGGLSAAVNTGSGSAALTPTSNVTASPAAAPAPASYTPTTYNLNPETDTVSGQFNKLTQQDNPLIENAKTQANQQMNARGLLNSSIAVGAGELAADQVALPIAQADANANLNTGIHNTDIQNTASQFNAAAENQINMQQLTGNQQYVLGQLEWTNKNLLQANQSAGQFFSQMSTSIGDILKNENIPVSQKQQLVDKQVELLKNGLSVIGGISNLDLTGLLSFTDTIDATPPPAEPVESDPHAGMLPGSYESP